MSFLSTLGHALSSKTVWGAIGSGVLIAGQAIPVVQQYVPAGSTAATVLGLAMAGFTIYGRINAKQPLGPVVQNTVANTLEAVHATGADTIAPTGVLSTTIARPVTYREKIQQVAQITAIVKAAPPVKI